MPARDDRFWRQASAALVRIALARTRDPAKAQDLAQQAIVDAYAGWTGWSDREDLASFVSRASALMRRRWFNERRMNRRREDEAWMQTAAQRGGGLRRTPEELASVRERKARLLAQLFEQLKDDTVARAILEQTLLGHDTPAEQAVALGRDIREIRSAQRRLARAARATRDGEGHAGVEPGWEIDGREGGAEDDSYQDEGKS
jgi:DNA-directed RNA polymerase specialized sigma24 family protein